jgi:RNA polymerase sigma-70 factor (ECF subfamily)
VPKTRRLSDATLVRRSQQGDRRAFTALLARYDWRLRGLANALLLDRAEMDAALGIGYLRAWRDVVRINAREDVAAWLYRVTYNACIDQLRRSGDGPLPEPARPRRSMAAGLAALPAADRVAVVLVDREGFSPASAARILGLDPEALATTLDAARKHLTTCLPAPGEASDEVAADDGRAEAAAEAAAAEAAAVAADPDGSGGQGSAGRNGDGMSPFAGPAVSRGSGKAPTPAEAVGPKGNGATAAMGPNGIDAMRNGDGTARADVDGDGGVTRADGDGRETAVGSAGVGAAVTVDGNGQGKDGASLGSRDGSAATVDGNGDAKVRAAAGGDGDERVVMTGGNGDGKVASSGGNGDGKVASSGGNGDGQMAGGDGDGAPTGRSNGHNPNRGRGRRARRRAQHGAGQQASDPVEPTDGTP